MERRFPAPRIVRVLSVVQILFSQPNTNQQSLCKVEMSKLNRKLQKLQAEGGKVLGIYFTDVDREPHLAVQPQTEGDDDATRG